MKKTSAFLLVGLLLAAAIFISIRIGSVSVSFADILQAFSSDKGGTAGIIRDIRIPRVLMAVMVGANLAVSGVLLQGVMRNPLADPGITGISSGASVVVMILMLYLPGAAGSIPLFGFIGGILACLLIYSLAWKRGLSTVRIVLAGVAVNSILGGITSMISILNSDNLTIMNKGKICYAGAAKDGITEERLAQVYGIQASIQWSERNQCPYMIPIAVVHA